jgi:hypothetical protein
MRVPLRSWLAGAAAAAVLAYGAAGHGLPQPTSHEGMAGSTVGLCLLLVAVLGIVVLPRPGERPRPIRASTLPGPKAAPPPRPLDARERASPIFLQRFRN